MSEARAVGTTALPELKAPPEFGEKTSDNPAADAKTDGKGSDNPYVEGAVDSKPSDYPYGNDEGSKPIDPASEKSKDEPSPGF